MQTEIRPVDLIQYRTVTRLSDGRFGRASAWSEPVSFLALMGRWEWLSIDGATVEVRAARTDNDLSACLTPFTDTKQSALCLSICLRVEGGDAQ